MTTTDLRSAVSLFDLLADREQPVWLEWAEHSGDRIREPGLGRSLNGLGFVEARDLVDRYRSLPHLLQCRGDLSGRVVQIRAQTYESFLGGHARL